MKSAVVTRNKKLMLNKLTLKVMNNVKGGAMALTWTNCRSYCSCPTDTDCSDCC